MSLEDALVAVTRGDLKAALAHLLARWRDRKVASIGDAIDAVGAAAARGIEPPRGKTEKARHAAWLAMASRRDPAELGALLATVEARLADDTWQRFAALDFGDPRVAHRLADIVESLGFNPETHDALWKAIFAALAASEDPRIRDRIAGLPATWDEHRGWAHWQTQRVRQRHAGILPIVDARTYASATPDEDRLCRAIIAAIPAPVVGRAEELLAAIYEHPDDEAARSVYMDWLLERDDPRGELVRLQLAGEAPRRQEELLKEHAVAWLGPLATRIQLSSAVFERGFLAVCHLREPAYEIDEEPSWATVHTLLGAVPGSDACRTSSLRRLLNVDRRGIARLATLTRPLDVAVLQWDGPDERFDDAVYEVHDTRGEDAYATLAALERITVLPRLRRLELRGHAWWHPDPAGLPLAELERVLRAPLAANLEELALPAAARCVEHWLQLLERTRIARVELRPTSRVRWARAWEHQFERGPNGTFSRLRTIGSAQHTHGDTPLGAVGRDACELLDGLDAHRLDAVTVEIAALARSTVDRRGLAAALQRHGRALDDVLVFF